MNAAETIRTKSPAHPGSFIRHEIMEPLNLTVTAAAEALGVTRAALSAFVNDRASLSADMAIRVEKAFDISMETLMRMQHSFDIAEPRRWSADIHVARYAPAGLPTP